MQVLKRNSATLAAALALTAGTFLIVAASHVSFAQEQDVESPPAQAAPAPPPPASGVPTAPGLTIENEGEATAPNPAPAAPTRTANGNLAYTVRPGDSLGGIAAVYGFDPQELARVNRLSVDSVLRVGQILRIPNPFAAQVRQLQAQVQQLSTEGESARFKAQSGQARIQALTDHVERLEAANRDLEHGVHTLPWWRGMALTSGVAVLLMLGVTALTVLEWYVLRRRFKAMVEMNEAIRRLDQKYKVALAKAELRLQQLYGRRRAAPDESEKLKMPEQVEIDHLNQQLKELLEEHLERLGLLARGPRRRQRLRDMLGGVEPAQARAGRR